MEKKEYEINVIGCDDTTTFQVELTKKEFELVKRICETCTATSSYNCQPKMQISPVNS
jgi:hypothetical protein